MSVVHTATLIEQMWASVGIQKHIWEVFEQSNLPEPARRTLQDLVMGYEQELCNLCGILDEECDYDYDIDTFINPDKCSETNIELFVYQSLYDFENDTKKEKAFEATLSAQDLCAYRTAKSDEIGYRYVLDIKPTFNGAIVRSRSVERVGEAPPLDHDKLLALCDEIQTVLNTVYDLEY